MIRAAAIATLLAGLALGPGWAAAPAKKNPAKKPVAKKAAPKKTAARKAAPRRPLRSPVVSPKVRAESQEFVAASMDALSAAAIENPAALVPFFEQLYQLESSDGGPQNVRVLQYGDSHTASDDWANEIRSNLQARFGNGGPGYVLPGTPFPGYRRRDIKGGQSRNWTTEGLLTKGTDGLYGLGGASLVTAVPGQEVYLDAEGDRVELHFLRQPGGGRFRVKIDGEEAATISTDGELSSMVWSSPAANGLRRFTVETISAQPVKLFGWVTEKGRGITWETLGINGAQATISLRWEESQLAGFLANREPALIVLAYGTNETNNRDLTFESYTAALRDVIARFRRLAPSASILLAGPPDRAMRTSRAVLPVAKLDLISEAQRQVAIEMGCAFWDLRQRMGGNGAMKRWVYAGMAQGDYVHFTEAGYRLVGETMYKDLMAHYEEFRRARARIFQEVRLEGDSYPGGNTRMGGNDEPAQQNP